MKNVVLLSICLAVFSPPFPAAAAQLSEEQVRVTIDATPTAAALAPQVRVLAGEAGTQTLVITLTNTNSTELALRGATVEFPWVTPEGADWRIASGAWDMGQNPAHIYAAGQGEPIKSESYLLTRDAGDSALVGFTTWKTFTSKLTYQPGKVIVMVDGEGRRICPGETVALENIWFAHRPNWQDLLFAYADEIVREHKIKLNRPKPYIGWATWDYYGRDWTAKNVTDNLDALLQVYPEADFLQIDGGWWPQRGDYTRVKHSLEPDGMKTLGHAIRAKGMVAGIHLDGMRGDSKAIVAKEHPDYFLKDQHGEMLVKSAAKGGDKLDYIFFDYSNPAARDYISQAFALIRRDWGFDYFKVDFLRYGLNEFIEQFVNRGAGEKRAIVPFDRSLTSVERFHLGMAAIRSGMGADAYFVACSAVFGPTFGHVDGLRSGADISPGFRHYKKSAADTASSFFLQGKVVYNDADYVVVRAREDQDATLIAWPEKNGGDLKLNEAEMWAHYVGLFGGIKLSSDNLPILREERRALFRLAASLPTSERYVPIDFWQHASHNEDPPAVMLGEAGGVVHLGVFNWTDAPRNFQLRGLTATELKGVTKLGGEGVTQTKEGTLTVRLPARHSTIYRIDGATFDRLRRAMQVACMLNSQEPKP